jgi:hypothetical protein
VTGAVGVGLGATTTGAAAAGSGAGSGWEHAAARTARTATTGRSLRDMDSIIGRETPMVDR